MLAVNKKMFDNRTDRKLWNRETVNVEQSDRFGISGIVGQSVHMEYTIY